MSDGIEIDIMDRRSAQLLKLAANASTLDEANAALAALENYTRLRKLQFNRVREEMRMMAQVGSDPKKCA